MIFVTVGMQLSFDRLIKAMDEIAPSIGHPIIAQCGNSAYQAKHMKQRSDMTPEAFEDIANEAQLIVSHAGIGTVLTAAQLEKPIVLFPRRAVLKEHRNDHQLATCQQLDGRPGIITAMNKTDLLPAIRTGLKTVCRHGSAPASTQQLKTAISSFITCGKL